MLEVELSSMRPHVTTSFQHPIADYAGSGKIKNRYAVSIKVLCINLAVVVSLQYPVLYRKLELTDSATNSLQIFQFSNLTFWDLPADMSWVMFSFSFFLSAIYNQSLFKMF